MSVSPVLVCPGPTYGASQDLSGLFFLSEVRPSLSLSHTDDGIVLKHGDEFMASVVSLYGDVTHTKLRIFRIKWDKT